MTCCECLRRTDKRADTNQSRKRWRRKIDFYKEGQKEDMTASNTSNVVDKRFGRLRMVSVDIESRLVSSL